MKITRIGLDLAKNVLSGVRRGCPRQACCRVSSSARRCKPLPDLPAPDRHGSSRQRPLLGVGPTEMGHTVKLIAPQFVKPYVKGNKNDANDAGSHLAGGRQLAGMRFVPVKTIEQLHIQARHRVRSTDQEAHRQGQPDPRPARRIRHRDRVGALPAPPPAGDPRRRRNPTAGGFRSCSRGCARRSGVSDERIKTEDKAIEALARTPPQRPTSAATTRASVRCGHGADRGAGDGHHDAARPRPGPGWSRVSTAAGASRPCWHQQTGDTYLRTVDPRQAARRRERPRRPTR